MASITLAHAADYTAINLGSLGGSPTYPFGINSSGQVVGTSTTSNGDTNAFITGPNGQGMTDLGTLPGYTVSGADGVNSYGQVVGYSASSSSLGAPEHAFITSANGQGMFDLGTLGGSSSESFAINDNGQVVGASFTSSGSKHAFITGYNGQGMIDLGTLGGQNSEANSINANGQVAGWSLTSSGDPHAFITGANGQGMIDLGTLPGNNWSFANGINASGQVAGTSQTMTGSPPGFVSQSNTQAFITGPNGQGMIGLGTLGGSMSAANGVNDLGEVVGVSAISDGTSHAFVTGSNGIGMIDLNSLVTLSGGDYLDSAFAINDNGQILAGSNVGEAYLLTPVPEPESYALMLAGLSLVGVAASRRKQA